MKEVQINVQLPKKGDDHPVAMMVQIASRYEAKIYLSEGSRRVNAKSIMGMMALGVSNGQSLLLTCEGADEEAAAKALADYLTGSAA